MKKGIYSFFMERARAKIIPKVATITSKPSALVVEETGVNGDVEVTASGIAVVAAGGTEVISVMLRVETGVVVESVVGKIVGVAVGTGVRVFT